MCIIHFLVKPKNGFNYSVFQSNFWFEWNTCDFENKVQLIINKKGWKTKNWFYYTLVGPIQTHYSPQMTQLTKFTCWNAIKSTLAAIANSNRLEVYVLSLSYQFEFLQKTDSTTVCPNPFFGFIEICVIYMIHLKQRPVLNPYKSP